MRSPPVGADEQIKNKKRLTFTSKSFFIYSAIVGVRRFELPTTRPPAVERIFVFIGIGLEISDTIPCEWGDVLYLLRLSEMRSVIKM